MRCTLRHFRQQHKLLQRYGEMDSHKKRAVHPAPPGFGARVGRVYSSNFLKTTVVLWPPKPKAFDIATFTGRSTGALKV